MLSKGVAETGLGETLASQRTMRRQSGAQFRAMLEQMGQHPRAGRSHRAPGDLRTATPPPAATPAPAAPAAIETRPVDPPVADPGPAPAPPRAEAPMIQQPVVTVTARQRLSERQTALLRNPDAQFLDMLPAELTAGDSRYNAREATLRENLNVGELERRLRDSARRHEVDFHISDLEGILRNAGYDAAHLGSTERYMAAVERFMGEAENNYRQRSSNTPGSNA